MSRNATYVLRHRSTNPIHLPMANRRLVDPAGILRWLVCQVSSFTLSGGGWLARLAADKVDQVSKPLDRWAALEFCWSVLGMFSHHTSGWKRQVLTFPNRS